MILIYFFRNEDHQVGPEDIKLEDKGKNQVLYF